MNRHPLAVGDIVAVSNCHYKVINAYFLDNEPKVDVEVCQNFDRGRVYKNYHSNTFKLVEAAPRLPDWW
jgi:hypothetical protein